ncbi:72_t:CDS:2 [Diversispora eburnea]|uniref:72_t:CDS:1 n=1 Tax=Diversispora eburnea TaxID=1213867 RepID=A0A9N9C8E0_9GLOM|nr:72_t:CDS:2 [Diversispora eburnea]
MKNTNDTSTFNISDNTLNSDVAPERIENKNGNTSEEKAIDEFLDSKHRETVSKEIIQSIKEKKLRDQEKIITSQGSLSVKAEVSAIPVISTSQPKILSEKQNNLKNNRFHIINKVLEQYPNITLQGSSNYFDDYVISASLQDNTYKITDSLSVCPACNQYHRESILGRYREGSYYINCLFSSSKIGIAITA